MSHVCALISCQMSTGELEALEQELAQARTALQSMRVRQAKAKGSIDAVCVTLRMCFPCACAALVLIAPAAPCSITWTCVIVVSSFETQSLKM